MGRIGIRCSRNRNALWFHLDKKLAQGPVHPGFRTDGADKALNDLLGLRHPWNDLTLIGSRIVVRMLAIPKVIELQARSTYFCLEVAGEESWSTILPEVVRIIREETNDPQGTVTVQPSLAADIPQWHIPLLKKLFG